MTPWKESIVSDTQVRWRGGGAVCVNLTAKFKEIWEIFIAQNKRQMGKGIVGLEGERGKEMMWWAQEWTKQRGGGGDQKMRSTTERYLWKSAIIIRVNHGSVVIKFYARIVYTVMFSSSAELAKQKNLALHGGWAERLERHSITSSLYIRPTY